jgi:hypothetical protein
MNRLRNCLDSFRVLARSPESEGRVRVAEIRINEYLGPHVAAVRPLLEQLRHAIGVESASGGRCSPARSSRGRWPQHWARVPAAPPGMFSAIPIGPFQSALAAIATLMAIRRQFPENPL